MIKYYMSGEDAFAIKDQKVYRFTPSGWGVTGSNVHTLSKFVPDLVEVAESDVPEKLDVSSLMVKRDPTSTAGYKFVFGTA